MSLSLPSLDVVRLTPNPNFESILTVPDNFLEALKPRKEVALVRKIASLGANLDTGLKYFEVMQSVIAQLELQADEAVERNFVSLTYDRNVFGNATLAVAGLIASRHSASLSLVKRLVKETLQELKEAQRELEACVKSTVELVEELQTEGVTNFANKKRQQIEWENHLLERIESITSQTPFAYANLGWGSFSSEISLKQPAHLCVEKPSPLATFPDDSLSHPHTSALQDSGGSAEPASSRPFPETPKSVTREAGHGIQQVNPETPPQKLQGASNFENPNLENSLNEPMTNISTLPERKRQLSDSQESKSKRGQTDPGYNIP